MKNKSLKLNTILSIIKGVLSIVFPIITFPYVSRILGVENLGKYNYSNSIVSYFVLFAGLGISTYAIREISKIREDNEKVNKISSEIFLINLFSTIVSYLVLIFLLAFVPSLSNYKIIILIISSQILLKTIGVEWIFAAYEDYVYITLRGIAFQIISIILMFALVKSENDVYIYSAIAVFSSVGSNIINFFRAKKYIKFSFKQLEIKKHLKPVLILFANALAVTIYVSSDITILGAICGDYSVGIYSVSVKVYTIMKTILSSALVVSVPRLSSILEKDKKEFVLVGTGILKTLLSFSIPCMVGMFMLSTEIVTMISSDAYVSANTSLQLLSIALLFCIGSWFFGNNILIPMRKEKAVFIVTIASALINVVLNLIMIPIWRENAAAFSTIISEAFTCVFFFVIIKKEGITFHKLAVEIAKVLIGCMLIIAICLLFKTLSLDLFVYSFVSVFFSVVLYFASQILLKNESLIAMLKSMKIGLINKIFRRGRTLQKGDN